MGVKGKSGTRKSVKKVDNGIKKIMLCDEVLELNNPIDLYIRGMKFGWNHPKKLIKVFKPKRIEEMCAWQIRVKLEV